MQRAPGLPENPVTYLTDVGWFKDKKRDGLVKRSELPAFHQAVMGLENPIQRDYLRLVLFTGLRRTEAATLRWDDIDFAESMIRLPAARTKAGRKLDLPMSDYIHDLLFALRHDEAGAHSEYVFYAHSRSGHIEEPRAALDAVAKASDIRVTVHDLRRTFITVAGGCAIPELALKALVNHSLDTNDVTATYYVPGPEDLSESMQKVTDKFKELTTPVGLRRPGRLFERERL